MSMIFTLILIFINCCIIGYYPCQIICSIVILTACICSHYTCKWCCCLSLVVIFSYC